MFQSRNLRGASRNGFRFFPDAGSPFFRGFTMARRLKSSCSRKMQSTTEHTGSSVVYGSGQRGVEGRGEGKVVGRLPSGGNRSDGGSRVSPFVKTRLEGDPVRVRDLPIRRVPVIPSHL